MVRAPRSSAPTPQTAAGATGDDLVSEIVQELDVSGQYCETLEPGSEQRLVDLRWAALGIGRQRGRRVRVLVNKVARALDAPVTVRVSWAPERRPAIPRQRNRPA
jgi:hypothetical protein